MKSFRFRLLASLAFAIGLAQGGPLLPCTGSNLVAQEEQSNCIVANPGGTVVITASLTNDPTFVDTPVSQNANQYQTTLTALLNGGTTIFQETFAAPFSDLTVQNAILQADGLLSMDGATFGGPLLTSTSTTLQSSLLSYVSTSPILDPLTVLNSCGISLDETGTCSGVMVTDTAAVTDTYGPVTVMIGPNYSDEFDVVAGQLDINVNSDFTYVVDRNAITTNTYLTAQTYEIEGTTESSSVPEPGTWTLMLAGLGAIWLGKRKRVSGRWGILPVLAFAIGLAQGGPLLPCTDVTLTKFPSAFSGGFVTTPQSGCIVLNPGGPVVGSTSYQIVPTFVNAPVSQAANQYQTTLTAILNGGATIFQETFDAPFSDPSVQNAIWQADTLLSSDGAIFGSPLLDSTSTALQSSVLSYPAAGPVFDLTALANCGFVLEDEALPCLGVTVTETAATTVTFGPASIMIGPNFSDEFDVEPGQTDININQVFTYTVDQNGVTTDTYLTTQSYEIDGTTNASSVPEPGTWTLMLAGLGAIWLGRRKRVSARWGILPVLALAVGLAQGGPLLPCTGSDLYTQEEQQSNCIVTNPGGTIVVTDSVTNDPTFANTPVSQIVNQYQTTLTAILNGGTTAFQESFGVPFSDASVQAAILQADAVLLADGATFGSPLLTGNSTVLQSSVTLYVATSTILDPATLFSCGLAGMTTTGTCSGVVVTITGSGAVTYGPATVMTGLGQSDVLYVGPGQEDINVNYDFVYVVDQNAITTNTYLTTQTYEIDGTTGSSSVPEPGTWTLMLAGLGAIWLIRRKRVSTRWGILPVLALAVGLAHAGPLLPCTGSDLVTQEEQQSDCLVTNSQIGGIVVTASFTNDPAFVNTPVSQAVNQYQTTLTALLSGGTTVFQETFNAPFSDPSVQNAISGADTLLASDGAAFGSPSLNSTSTMLRSSILSYAATSPAPDLASLIPCLDALVVSTTGTCAGVTVTLTGTSAITYGPATIMIGPGDSDEFYVQAGQQDINVDFDFAYTVDQNATTTNTYLTTQSYEIDGTTGSSSVPEPGTWALMLAGLGAIWLGKRKRVSARWGILPVLALAIGLAHAGPLLPCTDTSFAPYDAGGTDVTETQSNCVVANPGTPIVITESFTNDPTFVDTPMSQTVNQYQTILTALLNGGTTLFQEIFAAPFSDPSVQNAILQADALFSMNGAAFGSPDLTLTSTTLQSSATSYVPTSPVLDLPTLISCGGLIGGTCSGVPVTGIGSSSVTFGPATLMIGPGSSDEFAVEPGQQDVNLNFIYTYTVDRNAVTTNTYLTTQNYEIDGTIGASAVPEPGTWALMLAGLGGIWLAKKVCRTFHRLAPY